MSLFETQCIQGVMRAFVFYYACMYTRVHLINLYRRNFRPTWKLNVTEPVAGNFYPVNSRVYMRVNVYIATVHYVVVMSLNIICRMCQRMCNSRC